MFYFLSMPHKNDKQMYNWPKGKDQMWFTNRIDKFPNGTTLTAYPTKVLEKQVHDCLDKIASAQTKSKQWTSVQIALKNSYTKLD